MRVFRFLLPAFLVFAGFSGCSEKDPAPEPVQAQPKTFTGCRLIKTVYSDKGDGTEYIYDSRNNIVRVNSLASDGSVGSYITYDYDANGRIVSSKQYNLSNSATIYSLREYQYNSAGMLSLEKSYTDSRNLVLANEIQYLYDANGRVDSIWTRPRVNPNIYLPNLNTYEYDLKGNLLKRYFFPVQADGSIRNYPDYTETYSNYDTFKNPFAQPSFTLRQLNPSRFFTKNNHGKVEYGGNQFTVLYTYRPDSLVAEARITGSNSASYIYECN